MLEWKEGGKERTGRLNRLPGSNRGERTPVLGVERVVVVGTSGNCEPPHISRNPPGAPRHEPTKSSRPSPISSGNTRVLVWVWRPYNFHF
ncbi:unnamed protein product [Tuber melanosporum]|uniref:(Perigord truffle) hypothetical protein n=1 Tax=Tuber melanosporum (strain Mel28) TaxID=656061 RepID=D5GK67_TUBMM|nr:uncharacterized protein GSTUM_00009398001 [Tuber melanosporum]CAZ84910.1 unnamed protein product [Tuber melanosporum]